MKPLLIGLHGLAGSGKDTVASHLQGQNSAFYRYAFAEPIRAGLKAMLRISPLMFNHPHKERTLPDINLSPRQLMQSLGTEWGRACVNPDLWIILADQIRIEAWSRRQPLVITDVRFENEAHWVRTHGYLWHISRPNNPRHSIHADHTSEQGIEYKPLDDFWIENNGTLTDLQDRVKQTLTATIKRHIERHPT